MKRFTGLLNRTKSEQPAALKRQMQLWTFVN